MELNAYTRTIRTLFSTNVKYIVPRFQREYSWTKDEVSELWNDVVFNLIVKDSVITNNEYFIGSLVLIGEDRSTSLQIVDGQQRLTTITILLSALIQTFKDNEKDNLANAIYTTYIEGKDEDNNPFFKLVNENPKPFLQESIQHITKQNNIPANKEEKTLWESYIYFYNKLKLESLTKDFVGWDQIPGTVNEKYIELLKKIREQIVSYLKVIYITVASEDDAYMIFETLNARGKNLSSVDLVKNELFKKLRSTHPDDTAKRNWKQIQENLASRNNKINIETFFRHYWLSKYNFVTESKIFKSFKKASNTPTFNSLDFLNDLKSESDTYIKIAYPLDSDWTSQDDKYILSSLKALHLFNISQIRTFLLALLLQRENRKVTHSDFYLFLQKMEKFHFKYTAICSLKMNIFEGKYSKAARDLRNVNNPTEAKKILESLITFYKAKEPEQRLFLESFKNIKFTKTVTKDKKLIQYIFKKIENNMRPTDEVIAGHISLEHILSQSSKGDNIGAIGNLLPLDKDINSNVGDTEFDKKLIAYQASELKIVESFISENSTLSEWKSTNINSRTTSIGKLAYNDIWKIN
ncbi:DUF262 domain-containing HNH endonuclease family protein [Tenacibaculum dicentrarchi]|nr:DUF262 domain-containing HNH endonuclease family protein [Tenacibaculum dicentrarchi]MCD8443171.1 DUF262 domain-containing HNH endonuclease family protein [Tenacibaculum dicentrarchi]